MNEKYKNEHYTYDHQIIFKTQKANTQNTSSIFSMHSLLWCRLKCTRTFEDINKSNGL
jgi:hypothetical protein